MTPLQRQIMVFLSSGVLTGRELCQEIYSHLPDRELNRGHQSAVTREVWHLEGMDLVMYRRRDDKGVYELTAKGKQKIEDVYAVLEEV